VHDAGEPALAPLGEDGGRGACQGVAPFAGARIETLLSASPLAGRGFVGVDLVRRTPARRLGMDGGSLLVADRDRLAGLSPER
jgi:hypothetical protein